MKWGLEIGSQKSLVSLGTRLSQYGRWLSPELGAAVGHTVSAQTPRWSAEQQLGPEVVCASGSWRVCEVHLLTPHNIPCPPSSD